MQKICARARILNLKFNIFTNLCNLVLVDNMRKACNARFMWKPLKLYVHSDKIVLKIPQLEPDKIV